MITALEGVLRAPQRTTPGLSPREPDETHAEASAGRFLYFADWADGPDDVLVSYDIDGEHGTYVRGSSEVFGLWRKDTDLGQGASFDPDAGIWVESDAIERRTNLGQGPRMFPISVLQALESSSRLGHPGALNDLSTHPNPYPD